MNQYVILFKQGLHQLENKQFAEASETFRNVLQINNTLEAQLMLARSEQWAFVQNGKFKDVGHKARYKASKIYEELIARAMAEQGDKWPHLNEAICEMAVACEVSNDVKALQYYSMLLERTPENEAIKKKVAELSTVIHGDNICSENNSSNIGGSHKPRKKFSRFPDIENLRAAPNQVLALLAGDYADYPKFISNDAKFFTMGSCFAREIGLHLTNLGYETSHYGIGEEINSTYANLYFIKNALGLEVPEKVKSAIDRVLTRMGGAATFRASLYAATTFIITLGVAPVFKDEAEDFVLYDETDASVMAFAKTNKFTTTTVDENKENILKIIELLTDINPECHIVLTVSPVPLKVSFEFMSSVNADCLSKCTLRVAVNEVIKTSSKSIIYWPSFEMVRWVSGYTKPAFAVDDDSPFHVSTELVHEIISSFVTFFHK